jgi:hypothetical protein
LCCPAASKAGCYHHAGASDRSFSVMARHCENSRATRSNWNIFAKCILLFRFLSPSRWTPSGPIRARSPLGIRGLHHEVLLVVAVKVQANTAPVAANRAGAALPSLQARKRPQVLGGAFAESAD